MGHRKVSAPRRGSLAYRPRGRAKSLSGRVRYWPDVEGGPALLGFAGYKAGMTHVFAIEDMPRSPHVGKEVFYPVTVLDAPPMYACGLRVYEGTSKGLKSLTEAWVEKQPRDLARKFSLPDSFDTEGALDIIDKLKEQIAEIRLFLCTQPRLAAFGRKKPHLMEVKIGGGTVEENLEYAKSLLGEEISASNVFESGEFVDVVSVTKGKGFQGPVKRHGIRILSHKSRKTKRGVGSIGPWHPAHVMSTVPRAGQMGLSQRIEYNKRIMKIGSDGPAVTPEGGFLRYGTIDGDYVMLSGSVPGPAKRLVTLRYPCRPPKNIPEAPPQIVEVSQRSQMK